jgi:hypothetical protein
MAFIQSAPTTTEKIARGRQANTMLMPLGTIAWEAACTGLLPSGLPLNSKTTCCGRESQRPPTDGGRGGRETKRLNPTMPHSLKHCKVYPQINTLVYPHHPASSKSTNPITPQSSPNQQSHQKLATKSPNNERGKSTSNKTTAQPPHANWTQLPT